MAFKLINSRPRNAKEIKENSQTVITTQGVKGKELTVKTSQMDSTSKTYTFDKVFGPDSTQQMVFDDVVSNMLSEVLLGYNCTIFAYGKTCITFTHY